MKPHQNKPLHVRDDAGIAVLGHFGNLMNDPRHFDAAREVRDLLDRGVRGFVLELRGLGELGGSGLGLLLTITRLVRRHGGEAVLARPSRAVLDVIREMQMEDYWEVFDSVEAAVRSLGPPGAGD